MEKGGITMNITTMILTSMTMTLNRFLSIETETKKRRKWVNIGQRQPRFLFHNLHLLSDVMSQKTSLLFREHSGRKNELRSKYTLVVFKTKIMNEIKPALLFSWPASDFLDYIFICPSPFLTSYALPPEIYLNLFFIIPYEILYT